MNKDIAAVQAALRSNDLRKLKFALARLAIARGRSTQFSSK